MKFKTKLGKWLIIKGIKLAGAPTEHKTEVKQALNQPLDAVVEVADTVEQWAPEQHGNVIVAEPLLITKYRREGGDIHDTL